VDVFTGLRGGGQRRVCRADGLVAGPGRSRYRGHVATSSRFLRRRDHHVTGEPARAFGVRRIARVRMNYKLTSNYLGRIYTSVNVDYRTTDSNVPGSKNC